MKDLFTKQQLIEIVAERVKWLKELGIDYIYTTVPKMLVFNCVYQPKLAKRFTKHQLVEAIQILDKVREEELNNDNN